jgi:hypothetical protein
MCTRIHSDEEDIGNMMGKGKATVPSGSIRYRATMDDVVDAGRAIAFTIV